MKQLISAGLFAAALAACGGSDTSEDQPAAPEPEASDLTVAEPAAEEPAATPPAGDYADAAKWLCRPDKADDACSVDLRTTIVNADGTTEIEAFIPAEDPAIDCFYVYPTISQDLTPNSDLEAGPEEQGVVAQQFARLGSACRLYAPVYRQITLTALMANAAGNPMEVDRALAYGDVKDAWEHYLANDNNGRGVVLIGHSQGSGMLRNLFAEEIVGEPVQGLIVSFMPLGSTYHVDDDGAFMGLPPCAAPGQIRCHLGYVSFRDTIPPPADTRFGVPSEDGAPAACVNPSIAAGGNGTLDARLSTRDILGAPAMSFGDGVTVDTDYAAVPGLLSAACVEANGVNYLSVTVNADPADPRADDISGDVVIAGEVLPDWGLHLIDVHLAMGDLVSVVAQQAEAWTAE